MRPVPVAQRRVHLAAAVLPFVVLAALLLSSAPAGAAQDRRGGEVRMTWAGDVDNIDPAIADAGSSLIVHGATQELADLLLIWVREVIGPGLEQSAHGFLET